MGNIWNNIFKVEIKDRSYKNGLIVEIFIAK